MAFTALVHRALQLVRDRAVLFLGQNAVPDHDEHGVPDVEEGVAYAFQRYFRDGAAFPPFPKFVGSGAGVLAANAVGWNPTRKPVTTFPGALAPGRPPNVGDHDS